MMTDTIKYQIAYAPSVKDLEDIINKMIEHGWIPVGGPVTLSVELKDTTVYNQPGKGSDRIMQALVKREVYNLS
jgi:hypothetical protein